MSREQLVAITRRNLELAKADTLEQVDGVYRVPATNYYDPARWRLEVDRIFKRLPLMLALSSEVANPGDYKAMNVVGTPVLLTRGPDGALRAFVNMCSHRGAIVVPEGLGSAKRFTCPYHAWVYDQHGDLVGIFARQDFGDVDPSCLGLTPLPVAERAGMVWAILQPGSALDFDAFLSGYDRMLAHFGFEDWRLVARRCIPGPNWKVAYDGYLDLYHLPVLHNNTFGTEITNRATYDAWGPHQRVSAPDKRLLALEDIPEEQWDVRMLTGGVWTIFPHISIATFEAGGARGVLLSQLFPGDDADSSVTIQSFFLDHEPTEDERAAAAQMADFLEYVVREEDYKTGLGIQMAVKTGAKQEFLFGRNEGGGQAFHGWVDRLIATEDADLPALFATPSGI